MAGGGPSRARWMIGGGALFAIAGGLAFGVFEVHTAFYDVRADEAFDPGGARMALIARGEFHPVVHDGAGTAEIYRGPDGNHVLRLVDLRVDNGPALRVRVVALPDATDSESVADAEHLDLGPLRGNVGSQSYPIPAGFERTKHRSVSVWCERFSVNFAIAPLSPFGE